MPVQENESKPKPIVGGISPPYSADKGGPHLHQLAKGFLQLQHPLAYGSGFSLLLNPGSIRAAGTHVGELKDAKAKAGSAVNRSPDLTGDIDTLGAPAQACSRYCTVFAVVLYLFTIKVYRLQEGLQRVCRQAGKKGAGIGSLAYGSVIVRALVL